ncbi:pseudouridine synthase RluA family protein [Acanthocheilonema viteae]
MHFRLSFLLQSRKAKKRKHDEIDALDEMPENISFYIKNGIRYLNPYWSVYRTWAKGRWVGRRLIDIFAEEFVSLSPHYPAAACKLGRIWVNCNQMTNVNYIVQHNDSIEHIGHRHEHPILDHYIRVIYNDTNILVVNKPPSMPVHPCGRYSVHTVLGMLREQRGLRGLRVVHRLDRTTSGVLLFARNAETDIKLKKMLRVGEIQHKEYLCKVEGVFPADKEIVCDRPIGPLVVSMGIQCIRDDGKCARSRFLRLWTDGQTSIVRCMLETGRTHQIRVHLQYLGYPIVDDYIYNTAAWGETKGKDGNYGKSLEQLQKDVLEEHKASNWHEYVDPEYEIRIQRIAEGEVQPESEGLDTKTREEYDPICMQCNVKKKDITPEHMMLHLHCLRYQTSEWCYSSEIPSWAIKPNGNQDSGKTTEDAQGNRYAIHK